MNEQKLTQKKVSLFQYNPHLQWLLKIENILIKI